MKKKLSIILMLVMIFTGIPTFALAAEEGDAAENSVVEEQKNEEKEQVESERRQMLEKADEEGTKLANVEDEASLHTASVDQLDEWGNLYYWYNESNGYGEGNFSNDTLSGRFVFDGSGIYCFGFYFWDAETDDYLSDANFEIRIKNETSGSEKVVNEINCDQLFEARELGKSGDIISVSLKKKSNSRSAIYDISINKYLKYAERPSFPRTINAKLGEETTYQHEWDECDEEDWNEAEGGAFYRAHYTIDDESIAELDEKFQHARTVLTIKPKNKGTATITETLPNGKSCQCKLTVSAGLKYEENTVYIKESFQNELIGAEGAVKWSTSNKKVATVSSTGIVTGVKKGTATITAKNEGKSYTCKVTVKNPEMEVSSITPIVGQSYQLSVNGGNGKIKWSTSDKKIATVSSSGNVVAKKAGSCTVYAVRNGVKASCKVTVYSKFSLSDSSYHLVIGADGFDEDGRVFAVGGIGEIKWSSSNEKVVCVESLDEDGEGDNGYIWPIAEGSATITAERDGYSASCKVVVEEYSNVVYAPEWRWDEMTVKASDFDEDGWWIKFRPTKTGYMRVGVSDSTPDAEAYVSLINPDGEVISEDCEIYCDDEDEACGEVSFGVKKGQYYYLCVNAIYSDGDDYKDPTANLYFKNVGVTNACGYSKSTAKTISKNKTITGVHYAGECKAHWYKFKLTKASKLRIYFDNYVSPDAYITVYQGSKVISYGGSDGRCFEYYEGDTLSSVGKLKKGTYYVRVDTYDDTCTGHYTIKWY